jgi:hypothetical protein
VPTTPTSGYVVVVGEDRVEVRVLQQLRELAPRADPSTCASPRSRPGSSISPRAHRAHGAPRARHRRHPRPPSRCGRRRVRPSRGCEHARVQELPGPRPTRRSVLRRHHGHDDGLRRHQPAGGVAVDQARRDRNHDPRCAGPRARLRVGHRRHRRRPARPGTRSAAGAEAQARHRLRRGQTGGRIIQSLVEAGIPCVAVERDESVLNSGSSGGITSRSWLATRGRRRH